MKLLGSILIIISFSGFGIFKSFSLSRKCKILLELKNIIEALKIEIGFLKKDLGSALISASENSGISTLFSDFSDNLKHYDVDTSWYKSLENNTFGMYLTEDESDIVKTLSKGLGKTDADNQINHLNYVLTLISGLYTDACNEYKEKGNVYKSMGIATGILAALLLI